MTEILYPDVEVQLSGNDGNAFAIIDAVQRALRDEVSAEAASTYANEAMDSESYDALLQHAMRTVRVL